jgi:hypothetical protein
MESSFGWVIVHLVLLADHQGVKATIFFEKLRAGPQLLCCSLRSVRLLSNWKDLLNTESICSM